MSQIPADLKYAKSHEWVKPLADGTVEMGISDHAQAALGDFGHTMLGVRADAVAEPFFLRPLEPLGVAVVSEGPPTYGVELSPKGKASLCLYQTEEKPAHLHLAFTAENRQQVEAFYRAALEAGGKDNGAPGLRPHYHANYYAAFVIGPDGHNIEVVCHEPEA